MLTDEQRKIGRRNFLKAMATAPAAGAFAWAAYRKELHQKPLQAGIIGAGSEGRVLLENAPAEYIQFRAIADIRPDSRLLGQQVIKKRWDIGLGPEDLYAGDYRRMLEREDIEAVVIATPLWLHAEMAIAALQAGKHVFCEKTMAISVEECRAMVQAARNAGKVLQIGHQRHANRLYHSALAMIRDGLIGEIYHVRTLWHRNFDWRRALPKVEDLPESERAAFPGLQGLELLRAMDPRFDPAAQGYDDLEHLVNWRLWRKYSHGLLGELGSHQLDVTNWFSGSKPRRVMASGGLYKWQADGRDIDDHIYVIYDYPACTLAPQGLTVTFSSITTNKFDHYYEQFMGTQGTILLSGENQAMLWSEGDAGGKSVEVEVTRVASGAPVMQASESRGADAAGGQAMGGGAAGGEMDLFEPYRRELEGFCAAVKFGTPMPCSAADAVRAAVVVVKADEAARRGVPLDLPDELYAI